MRTKKEIETEINALKSLKPIGQHTTSTKSKIELAIEELEFGVDDTAAEFGELNSSEQEIVTSTRMWKMGDSDARPSEGWGRLVEEAF